MIVRLLFVLFLAVPAWAGEVPIRVVKLPNDDGVTRAQVTTQHYTIYIERYDPKDLGLLMESAYAAWFAFWGKQPAKLPLVLKGYASQVRYERGGKKDNVPTPAGGPAMGYYCPRSGIAHYYADSDTSFRYMSLHEGGHQFHWRGACSNREPGGGFWYVEGLATYFGWSRWDGRTFALGPATGIQPMGSRERTMEGFLGGQDRNLNGYLIAFISTQYPREFRVLADKLNGGATTDSAWSDAFGCPKAPEEMIAEYDRFAASGDPGFDGWPVEDRARALVAAVNVASWRLGQASPKSLIALKTKLNGTAPKVTKKEIAQVVNDCSAAASPAAGRAAKDLLEAMKTLVPEAGK